MKNPKLIQLLLTEFCCVKGVVGKDLDGIGKGVMQGARFAVRRVHDSCRCLVHPLKILSKMKSREI